MLVRVLWHNPQKPEWLSGNVYDVPDDLAQRMLDAAEAELPPGEVQKPKRAKRS